MSSDIFCTHFCTSFTIYTSRNNAACVTGAFTAREQALDAYVLQGVAVADDSYRR